MAVNTLERYRVARFRVFRWRYAVNPAVKFALALGMAGVTGLLAQLRFPLPWTPVPITGQTFAVLLAGVLLGSRWGGVSMALYGGLGLLGVPWFTGWTGGIAFLAGPTGGYVLGFILAALFIGHMTDRYVRARSFTAMLGLMLLANFVLIYLPGVLVLNNYFVNNARSTGLIQTLQLGVLPFIAGDVVKAVAAAAAARGLAPQQSFNGEADKDKGRWRLP